MSDLTVRRAAETFADMAKVPDEQRQMVEDAFVAGAAAVASLIETADTHEDAEELLEEIEELTQEMCERLGFDMGLPALQ